MSEFEVVKEGPFLDKDKVFSNFPFSFRGNQKDTLDKIVDALNRDEIKYVVIQAPTGLGKSPIGISLAKSVSNAFILTSNKMLQDQYVKDFSQELADLRGRANYRCNKYGTNCAASPCRASKEERSACNKEKACEYHHALDDARNRNVTSLNFSAGIAFFNHTPFFPARTLLIVDEAHLIEDNLTNVIEFSITAKTLDALIDRGDSVTSAIPKLENAQDYLPWLHQLRMFMNKKAEDFVSTAKIDQMLGLKITQETIENFARKLTTICAAIEEDANNMILDHLFVDEAQTIIDKISFKPINVSQYANDKLFKYADKTILMSATIINYKEFIRQLGIPEEQCIFIDAPSTFPKENRPIVRNYVDTLNHGNMEKNMPKIINECKMILKSHATEKGIIHTHTYSNAKSIYNALKAEFGERLLFPENSSKQKEMIERHAVSKIPTVLISPSMTEGLDLKDDLGRFQVIVKVPYPSLMDKVVKARMSLNPGWYSYKTALTIIQAYGRSTRTETDYSITYILDGNFEKLVAMQKKSLPRWFTDAIL